MKIAIDLTAYEILLLRGALYAAAVTSVLEKDEALALSQRLNVERKRFPEEQLGIATTAFRKKYGSVRANDA